MRVFAAITLLVPTLFLYSAKVNAQAQDLANWVMQEPAVVNASETDVRNAQIETIRLASGDFDLRAVESWSTQNAYAGTDLVQTSKRSALTSLSILSAATIEPELSVALPKADVIVIDRNRQRTIDRLEAVFHVMNAADVGTTLACLQREGCQEVNPLYGSDPDPIVIVASKLGYSLAYHYMLDEVKRYDRGWAEVMAWTLAVFQSGVVGWNLKETF